MKGFSVIGFVPFLGVLLILTLMVSLPVNPVTAQMGLLQETPEGTPEIPVTGPGFSVAQVAQPNQGAELGFDVQLVKVADGLIDPVNVVAAPDGSGRLFVVERSGTVRIVSEDGEVQEEPFLDITDKVLSAFLEQGLYDLEFHPDFASNGKFYVHFAELLRNGDSMIVEYTVSGDNPNQADPDSARVILHIEQPYANHNGGELAFGPDGYLYIGSGDGGWEGDPLEAGQDLKTLLGKVLRIDVNTEGNLPYAFPEDNPFTDPARLVELFNIPEAEFAEIHSLVKKEIWAWGLRNPWKFQFDPETGDLYLPDVGQNHWEEINFQPADSTGGENYGWDYLMGTHCHPVELESCEPFGVLPVAEYNHDLGQAVAGLGVYRGGEFPELDGVYFVGDWGSGRIWGLQRGDDGTWIFDEVLDTETRITAGGTGTDGELYVTTCFCEYSDRSPQENQPGSLWRLVPADQVPEGAETAPVAGEPGQPTEEVTGTPEVGETPTEGDQTPAAGETPTAVNQTPAAGESPAPGDQATPETTPEPGDQDGDALIQQGGQVFSSVCAGCHGAEGQGNIGPALAGNALVTAQDPSMVIDIVLHGSGIMPAFEGQLTDEEIAAVISYIRNTWGNEAPPVSPEQVQQVVAGASGGGTPP